MDKKKNRRDMILEAALDLFSQKGYDATTIDEIGDALNMKGPALYHYFKGKEALLDALIEEANAHYEQNFGSTEHIEQYPECLDDFIEMTYARLDFTIHDPVIKKVRRFLAMEQFRNEKCRRLTTRHHLTGVEKLNAFYIEKLIELGEIKKYDPELLAFEFSSPVTMLIHLIDREPEKEEEAMQRIRLHLEHFVRVYGVNKQ